MTTKQRKLYHTIFSALLDGKQIQYLGKVPCTDDYKWIDSDRHAFVDYAFTEENTLGNFELERWRVKPAIFSVKDEAVIDENLKVIATSDEAKLIVEHLFGTVQWTPSK